MNILQVSHSFYPCYQAGGVVRVAYDISRALVKRGHQVTVVTTDGCTQRLEVKTNTEVNVEGVQVWYFRNISNYLRIKFKFATPYLLPFFMRKHIRNFDIIHIHEHRTILAVITHYYAKKYGVPYIIQGHGDVLQAYQKQKLKLLFDYLWGYKILNDATKAIALTKSEKDQYIQMGLPEDKIEIIPNGIDVSEYEKLPNHGKFRKKYGIALDEKIILYLGRMNRRKGLDFLVDGFSRFLDEKNNCKLLIVGPDDGYRNILIQKIKKLKITKNVLIVGQASNEEKIEAFVDADVLVYPGILEIFGLVPFEAIMCGTPVIVTDDCGCGELVKGAKCGYLVKYGDINALKEQIKYVLNNSTEAKQRVLNGQHYIKINLTYENVIEKFIDLYMTFRK